MTQIDSELSGRRTQPRHEHGSNHTHNSPHAHRGLVRMALDLHDGPLQDLTAVGFTINRLQQTLQQIEATTSQAMEQLADVQRQLGAAESGLRSVASEDTGLGSSTMIELIDKETAVFKTRSHASVEIRVVGEVEPETASQRIAIQRVLRECLANVARHSRARNVCVSVIDHGDAIELSVMDDGVGFDPQGAHPNDERVRLGLTGMRRRLELLDGTLTVTSQPGGPTCMTATVKRWTPGTRGPQAAV